MTTEPNSSKPSHPAESAVSGNSSEISYEADPINGEEHQGLLTEEEIATIAQKNREQSNLARYDLPRTTASFPESASGRSGINPNSPQMAVLVLAIALLLLGWIFNLFWFGIAGSFVAFVISLQMLWGPLQRVLLEFVPEQERIILLGSIFGTISLLGLLSFSGVFERIGTALANIGWDAIGALGEVLGAVGQILIAVLAVYIAWRQYIISRDLTIQQNTITQQQTIDTYFQGVSDLVLDEEGLLEDWPQERAIAEGRTAAILSSVDASGKAKIIRFLSRARLLSPLRRDLRLGRAILDGSGGYEEDRLRGVRVIDLGVMLAGSDLSGTDLRWTDLSDANLIRVNLNYADLVKTNLSRTILFDAKLRHADLNGTRFFYGKAETASPRSRTESPDYRTGQYTGAVIEGADLTKAVNLSEEQRYYCCAWGGSKTRSTIPGGCAGIPNKLGR